MVGWLYIKQREMLTDASETLIKDIKK